MFPRIWRASLLQWYPKWDACIASIEYQYWTNYAYIHKYMYCIQYPLPWVDCFSGKSSSGDTCKGVCIRSGIYVHQSEV